MIVGIAKLTLRIYECYSLKEKRRVLRRIKDRTANAFGVTVAETDHQDVWQQAELGFAIVGNDRRAIESLLEKTSNYIEEQGPVAVCDRATEMITI